MISAVAVALISLLFIVFVTLLIYGHLMQHSVAYDDTASVNNMAFDDLEFKHWYPEQKLQINKNFYTLNYTNGSVIDDHDDDSSISIVSTQQTDGYIEDPFI